MQYELVFPGDFDEYDWWETGKKGWLDVRVVTEHGIFEIAVYDTTRLVQSIEVGIRGDGYHVEKNLVVVPTVTRQAIVDAVAWLAGHDFADLGR